MVGCERTSRAGRAATREGPGDLREAARETVHRALQSRSDVLRPLRRSLQRPRAEAALHVLRIRNLAGRGWTLRRLARQAPHDRYDPARPELLERPLLRRQRMGCLRIQATMGE